MKQGGKFRLVPVHTPALRFNVVAKNASSSDVDHITAEGIASINISMHMLSLPQLEYYISIYKTLTYSKQAFLFQQLAVGKNVYEPSLESQFVAVSEKFPTHGYKQFSFASILYLVRCICIGPSEGPFSRDTSHSTLLELVYAFELQITALKLEQEKIAAEELARKEKDAAEKIAKEEAMRTALEEQRRLEIYDAVEIAREQEKERARLVIKELSHVVASKDLSLTNLELKRRIDIDEAVKAAREEERLFAKLALDEAGAALDEEKKKHFSEGHDYYIRVIEEQWKDIAEHKKEIVLQSKEIVDYEKRLKDTEAKLQRCMEQVQSQTSKESVVSILSDTDRATNLAIIAKWKEESHANIEKAFAEYNKISSNVGSTFDELNSARVEYLRIFDFESFRQRNCSNMKAELRKTEPSSSGL